LYPKTLFPKLNPGIPISVHDIIYRENPPLSYEGGGVVESLQKKQINYFSAAPEKDHAKYQEITQLKRS